MIKKIFTRFPPEPNGYLHIGHAKSILINFGIAKKYNGSCNLRFDNTNPKKEKKKYFISIKEDIKWLGFDLKSSNITYASNYFDKMYYYACLLIKKNKAYVCDLSKKEIKIQRGTFNNIGKNSFYRNRSVRENLLLFDLMKKGKINDGEKVLRAKIDMKSSNLNMRDPVIYRIIKNVIYPTYDFSHPLEDFFEGITHSFCSLEFENHRPLYEWILNECNILKKPKQIEFARLNISNMPMSKREIQALIKKKIVNDWDDPRLFTIKGLKRRGYTPQSIRNFIFKTGISKSNSIIIKKQLEAIIRNELDKSCVRVTAIFNPIKVVIKNFKDNIISLNTYINPQQKEMGTRKIYFTKEFYIEKNDFSLNPSENFFRLSLGKEVRLKDAFYIKCIGYKKNFNNEIIEIHCNYDKKSKGGWIPNGRKIKGTIHWISSQNIMNAKARFFEDIYTKDLNGQIVINNNSFKEKLIYIEKKFFNKIKKNKRFQFIRNGYFIIDQESSNKNFIFNKIVDLKQSYKDFNSLD